MIEKLSIGTVQFGLDYGINNSSGQVSEHEVKAILNLAKSSGIDTLDTAYAYGNSEAILGATGLLDDFKVVSKLPPSTLDQVDHFLKESLTRLDCSQLYGYILHNFSIYQKDKSIWERLMKFKKEKIVKKIGVSLYTVEELEKLWDDGIELDLVQVPFNLFDRRFATVFPELKKRGVEIHTRSTFLQGLFFKSLADLPLHFESVRTKLAAMQKYCQEKNESIASLCLNFAVSNPYIDRVVIGSDKIQHLAENIKVVEQLVTSIYADLEFLATEELDIINPSLWKI